MERRGDTETQRGGRDKDGKMAYRPPSGALGLVFAGLAVADVVGRMGRRGEQRSRSGNYQTV